MLHRQTFASRNLSGVLQTVFEVVTRVVNCIKNSPFRGRLFAKLFDKIEAEHTVLLCQCETHWLSCDKVLHGVYEFKEEVTML
jgi:hypothetical protein